MNKKRSLLLLVIVLGFITATHAQVLVEKQIQMTGTIGNDRRITNVGIATDSTDAVSALAVQRSYLTYAVATGVNNTYAVTLPVKSTGYMPGMVITFQANTANTGAISLNVNGMGAKNVFHNVNTPLIAGDIVADQMVTVIYDGVNFQVLSPLAQVLNFTGVLSGEVSGPQNATVIEPATVTTAKIADANVTTLKIANGAVTTTKIIDDAVTTAKILDANVTNGKIANDAITTAKILNANVTTPKIADASITTVELVDLNVTTGKIADANVTTPKIADDAVTSAKIINGAIVDADVSAAAGIAYSKLSGTPTSLPPTGTAGGDLAGTYPNPTIAVTATAGADAIAAVNAATTATINAARLQNTVTTQSNTFNGNTQLVQTNATGQIPTSVLPAHTGDVTSTAGSAALSIAGNATAGNNIVAALTNANTGAIPAARLTLTGQNASNITTGTFGAANASNLTNLNASQLSSGTIPAGVMPAYTGDVTSTAGSTSLSIAGNAIAGNNIVTALNNANAGAIPAARLTLTGQNAANITSGTFGTANASNLTNLNASQLITGTVATGRLGTGTADGTTFLRGDNTWVTPSTSPTGAAGGDLTNTYPNPTIAVNAVTSAKVLDGTLVNADVSPTAAIAYSKINLANSIQTTDLVDGSVTDAKVANGIAYSKLSGAPTSLPPSGAAGGDLTNTYPNPAIAVNAVTSAKVLDGTLVNADVSPTAAIAYSKLALTNSIVTNDVVNASITTAKIADANVTIAKIDAIGTADNTTFLRGDGAWIIPSTSPTGAAGGDLTNTYPNPTIAANAITSAKILDGTIVNADVSATAAIAYSKINLANSIQTTDIIDGSVTDAKVANGIAYSKLSGAPTSLPPSGAAGGDITGTYPNPTIAANAVTSAKIADGTITNADVSAAAAIAYSKLNLTGSVQGSDIAAGTFTTTNAHHAIGNNDNTAREVRFLEPSGSGVNYTAFKAQAQAGDITYTLPNAAPGATGDVIQAQAVAGNNVTLGWATPSSGGGGTGFPKLSYISQISSAGNTTYNVPATGVDIIGVDMSSDVSFNVVLPPATAANAGKVFMFKIIKTHMVNFPPLFIKASGTDKVDGGASINISNNFGSANVFCDGAGNWYRW